MNISIRLDEEEWLDAALTDEGEISVEVGCAHVYRPSSAVLSTEEARRLGKWLLEVSLVERDKTDDLQPGEWVFNAKGRPVGVIAEIDDDQFIAMRHGSMSLPAEVTHCGGRGVVEDSIGPFVRLRLGTGEEG
jgi:hypothetical protein